MILDDDEPNTGGIGPSDQLNRRGRVRSGGLGDLLQSDNSYQVLQEVDSRLIHQWQFDVPATAESAVVNLEAFHGSSSEVFWVSYSADGGVNFKTMMTIRGGEDEDKVQRFELPDSARGDVWVKVTDSNPADASVDSLFVDRLVIEVEGEGTPPTVDASLVVAERNVRGSIVNELNFNNTFSSDDLYEVL